jgi:Tol biopolymer transport system component
VTIATTRTHGGRGRWSAALLACVALSVGGTAPSASATPPGANGRIAFMRMDDTGQWQTWVANPDLSSSQQITTAATNSSGWAVWSPDGARLAFLSDRTDPDLSDDDFHADIFTMRPDGSDVRQVTDGVGYSSTPAWSPDGRLLALAADRGAYPAQEGIFVVRPDGTGLRRVTTLPATSTYQESPRFSPDGSRLVFTEYRGGTEQKFFHRPGGNLVGEQSALFVVKVDGSQLRQVTPWGVHAGDADWSPDGARLVFETVFEHIGNGASVMLVDPDGKHLKVLTQDAGLTGIGKCCDALRFEASFDPVWSPDGSTILYSHDYFTPDGEFSTGLQTIAPDGTRQRYVSSVRDSEHQVDWGTAPLVP